MASCMRDEDIDSQLISDDDVEHSDGDEDVFTINYSRKKQQFNELKVTSQDEISDNNRSSRKRKASTDLSNGEPPKKMSNLQPPDSLPISPVRMSRRSKSANKYCPPNLKKQLSPRKRENQINHCSPNKANSNGAANKSANKYCPPNLKKQLSPHKRENQINHCSPNKANSDGAAEKNLTSPKRKPLKMYMSPSAKRNEWVVTTSPKKSNNNGNMLAHSKTSDTLDQVSDSENKDRNNTTRRIKIHKSLTRDEVITNPDKSSNNSSHLRKRISHNSTPQLSPDKEISVSLPKLKINLVRILCLEPHSKNEKQLPDVNGRHLENEPTPNKMKHQDENNESPATPSRKTNILSNKLATEESSNGFDDVSDIETKEALGIKNNYARDESKYQEDERRKHNITTPDKKTADKRTINNCKQSSTQKLNSGSPSNVHSPKVSTPLQKRAITVTTPISNKRTGRSLLTPGMAKRVVAGGSESGGRAEDALDATRRQLHVSTVPCTLPCREQEFDHIKSFLTRKIEHCAGGCMYISGVPGTGKTATVHAVIRYLQEEVRKDELTDFDFVEINGLRLTEPKQAYVRILQSLTDQKQTAEQAQQTLNKRFSRKSGKATVILVDELDYLCNRRQDVVYNLLEWPSGGGGGVVVVAISNTMDLPERALKGRVTSRMGLTRLVFRPYTHKQLELIVSQRLADHPDAFHPDAVQFVARKVAAVSGDARRALDICRRTTELVHVGEQVTPVHVERAMAQIFSGPRVLVIRRLCRLAQLVLRALRDTAERTGVEETTVAQMYKHLVNICQLEGCEVPSPGAVLSACVSLAGLGLVVGEKRRPDVTRKLCLNVSSDDIHYALNNNDTTDR